MDSRGNIRPWDGSEEEALRRLELARKRGGAK